MLLTESNFFSFTFQANFLFYLTHRAIALAVPLRTH